MVKLTTLIRLAVALLVVVLLFLLYANGLSKNPQAFFVRTAVVLFLLAVYYAQRKEKWEWPNVLAIAATLALVTYTYSIGRLLGMLMDFGLLIFATNYERFVSVLKTWAVYVVTLLPLLIFKSGHPGVLTQRFYLISYIKPESTWREIVPMFTRRYLADFSLISLLFDGDGNPRHHVQGSLGSFLIGAFILVVIGLGFVTVRHCLHPCCRFVIYLTSLSSLPAPLTP